MSLMIKSIFLSLALLISINANSTQLVNICLTGKIETMLPDYKVAVLNAAKLALSQNKENSPVTVKTYFYDSKPLSPVRAYNKMLLDHCSAIIGFEYLSDLLLISKQLSLSK
jgi:hypothetical protein